MKAAVFHGARDIRVEDVPDPELEPDGIIIKVEACGICGSDLHPYKIGGREGMIFGHEFSGEVAEVGASVAEIKAGDRVTGVGYRPCRQCYFCQQGLFYRCTSMALAGYALPGAMAEYIAIPFAQLGRTIFRVPDSLSHEEAATVEPLSVAFYSVRRAQPQAEETAVVLGAGVIGLYAIQVLKAMGVSKVIVSGRRAARLKAAKESGADLVIDAATEDPVPKVKEATSGTGVDIAVECAGVPATFEQAIQMVHGRGRVLLVGIYEQPINWNPSSLVNKNVSLIGCLGGSFPRAIELLESGKANAKPLLSHQFPLDKVKEAFETQIEAQDAVKVLVKP